MGVSNFLQEVMTTLAFQRRHRNERFKPAQGLPSELATAAPAGAHFTAKTDTTSRPL